MKIKGLFEFVALPILTILVFNTTFAQTTYKPPISSIDVLKTVDWSRAVIIGTRFRNRFKECESKDTCDGKKQKFKCSTDPSHNTALLQFPDGTIFFDAKMGLDTDGSPYSKKTPGTTDQPETSYRYPISGHPSVDADKISFIVIPGGGFAKELKLEQGDLAAVVFNGKIVYALVADSGPVCKIGEGSIQLHEDLGHRVCTLRNNKGECTKIKNISIPKDVLFFVFPKSKIDDLTPETARQRIAEKGEQLFKAFRGL